MLWKLPQKEGDITGCSRIALDKIRGRGKAEGEGFLYGDKQENRLRYLIYLIVFFYNMME